jgi:hypothetical protein
MLRISQINSDDLVTKLKVEGKLQGPWVSVLARACGELPCSSECLSLDLSAVDFADGPGVELLRGLLARGVTFAACSALVAELLRGEVR